MRPLCGRSPRQGPRRTCHSPSVVILAAIVMVAIFAPAAAVHASEVTLSWNPVAHPNLAGYKIHRGTSSGRYTRVVDVGNVTEYTCTDLQEDTTYYFAASAYDLDGTQSDLSNEVSFTTPEKPQTAPPSNRSPLQPVLFTPTHGQTWCDLTPRMTAGDFSDPDGDPHSKSRWQVSEVKSFSSLVLDISTNQHLTQLKVPSKVLVSDRTYYARVRFQDVHAASSDWSEVIQFTTAPQTTDINEDGVPDSQEVQNVTDLNNDGTPDDEQPEIIKCARSQMNGAIVGVASASPTILEIEAFEVIEPAEIGAEGETPGDLPLGLWAYRLRLRQPGATVQVTFYSSDPLPAGNFYKYDSITGWHDYTGHCTFNPDGNSLTVELQDGGPGDSDGAANGIIVDPGGLVATSSHSSSSNWPGACFIAAACPRHLPDRLMTTVVDALHRFLLTVVRDESSYGF